MKWLGCLFLFIGVFQQASAADTVIVRKDSRLDILTAKQALINKATSRITSNGQYRGYRVQVLITRSRDAAFKMKAELLQNYPDQKSYVLYQSPNFKVRLGNFTDRESAEKYRKIIAQRYPQGVFVVEDIIDYIPSDQGSTPEQ